MAEDNIESLQQLIMHGGTQAFSLIPAGLKKVILEEQWRSRTDKDGKPFATFEAFVKHRLWQGLETTIDELKLYCRKQPEVERLILKEMDDGATLAEEPRDEKGRYRRSNTTTGRGATYLAKRLKRDRPDLFQQVLDRKLSVNAATIKAGFRKQSTPLAHAMKAVSKLSDKEWQSFCKIIDFMRGKGTLGEGVLPDDVWKAAMRLQAAYRDEAAE
jgi:hypothetical protein